LSDLSILQGIVDSIYERHKNIQEGDVATYIPALAQADPDAFGIAITTINNKAVTAGDVDVEFSIQSVSKPFVYGLAIEDLGEKEVARRVGTEPSGESFNAIELDPQTRLPFNPMINAGAISTSGMLYDKYGAKTKEQILQCFSDQAGDTINIDESTFRSELDTASRNRALAYLMQSVGNFDDPVEEKLAAYFSQCSAMVSARKLSMMAATLANIGTHPATGMVVFSPLTVRRILSVMFTCGMYDFAGRWAVDVGLPAKSGVSGCVMAVVNRQIGIGIYSPRLDSYGNSVRGINSCRDLAEELGLHAFEFTNRGSSMLDMYMGN
jgi:glutaminase